MASERPLLIATTPGASTPDDAPSPHPPAASLLPPAQSEPPLRADRLAFSVEIPDPFRSYRRGDGPAADPSASLERERDVGDDESREVIVGESSPEFSGNAIRTAKYSFLTFLPRNLFEQFRRLSYVYFLAITVLNQLPQVAVFGRGASVLPLAFVLFVTAVKDAYEDFRRHRSDRQENNRLATVLALGTAGEFQPKRWKHIRVGDVVRIESNETLPADMVLLATSDPTGVAHVQTVNLDGETNLKTRYAKQETHVMFSQNGGVGGVLHCERPNRNIYGFQANLEIDGKRVSLGPSNIVLRGCELKNTTWAIGVVVYAGKETKVMLNSSGAPSKRSRLETQLNRETVILSIMLIGMCTTASVLAGIWLLNHRRELEFTQFFREKDYTTGKNYNYYGVGMQIFITFLMAVIVYQVIIPISLYISMELVRLGQAYFMGADKDLYDESSRSKFQCRALNINEDLGQIRYVFSDKTGTLTENKMVFQCASIRGVDYNSGKDTGGYSVVVGDHLWTPKMSVKIDPELVKLLRDGGSNEEPKLVLEFLLALASCNTIVPLVLDTRDSKQKLIDYQGESPDEQALAYAAASYGIVLVERTSGYIVIDVLGDRQRFDILGLHEFDSDRKRMSVIVGCPDKTVKLYVKGADSSVFGITNNSSELDIVRATEAHLHKYSSLGLRTLVVGMRKLSQSEFEEWQLAYENASTAVLGRGNLLRSVAANIEINVNILGATGIEDKLQDGVPEAIESIRQADIKVWILTGDKQETAISIGYSCKLLTNDMTQIVINNNSKESCQRSLVEALATTKKLRAASSIGTQGPLLASETSNVTLALIVDGNSLVYILETDLQDELFKLATECSVVLCCRVAPLQKAGIVALIKNRTNDMTLAIGDGANDVSMIQMADVGIGISGQEGRQAVMASDFSMGQFRFLVPLLLVHGHWNYQRMAYMILYNFYKNAMFVLVLFWYVLYTAFTLTTAITEWSSLLYTVLYTSLPTIVVGILDKDLNKATLIAYPKLYGSGQRDDKYNVNLFVLNMLEALWQSLVVFYLPYFAYRRSTIDMSSLGDLWALAPVIVVNMQLAMDIIRWNWIIHAFVWGTIAATTVCLFVIDSIWVLPGYGAIFHIMGTGLFWFLLLIIVVTAMVPHFVFKAFTEHFRPSDIQIAREMEKFANVNQVNRLEFPTRGLS
ncbi:phospholipid-transporting ATPase 1 isoform X1 [Zea mays]|uniref:Phospholipid-transporting ATPase n=5 Tax=Zea mays TaxID=4577 RepID=A0A1D6MQV4_MAIZE|nr:phospholipid-transporting ATPase 1 isoform X1 [Zea mays]ONM31386.1 Phospholipid-transporting ATPase 1 [Zea mays]|eukprot:XP_008673919.1 phospholipid-transporting ATPase 1 isoform X1 [Zea mays]